MGEGETQMKDDLKLLVVGSGGREHAIAKKLGDFQ